MDTTSDRHRRIGSVLVEPYYLETGRTLRFLRRPADTEWRAPTDVLSRVESCEGRIGWVVLPISGNRLPTVETTDPVDHWREVRSFRPDNVESFT